MVKPGIFAFSLPPGAQK